MRVLVVARWYPSHDSPGRGSFVADQVRALRAAGVDVVVASWEPALARSPDATAPATAAWAAAVERSRALLATPVSWGAGVPVARLPAVVPGDPAARHPVDLAQLQAATLIPFGSTLATEWPFDVVHAHTGLPDGSAASDLADRLGLPLVTTEHDGSLDVRLADKRARTAYARLAAEGRRLVAVSARLADQMSDLAGIDRSSIAVIPNLVDLELFEPDPETARRPGELLWVGNRKASKGVEALLRAFALVARSRPGARLRLIGKSPTPDDEAALRGLAAELGIADSVSFEDPVPRSDVAAAMARADLFVHPSPRESFGIVAIEALAAGLPVVAVAPTIADLIGRDGRLGEISDGPEAPAIASAIARALARRAEFRPTDLIAAARPYDAASVSERILETYRDAVAGSGRSGPRVRGATEIAEPVGPVAGLIVAGRPRHAIDRIALLPPESARLLTVVTTGIDSPGSASHATWIAVDSDARFRAELNRLGEAGTRSTFGTGPGRWLELILHPRRAMARRRLFMDRGRLAQSSFAAAVGDAHRRLGCTVPVLALDADDVVTVRDAGLAGHLAPTTLRSIADRHDEGAKSTAAIRRLPSAHPGTAR